VKCRSCSTCKDNCTNETVSIQEEIEQDLINRSVKVDIQTCSTIATLPLLRNPNLALAPNRSIALRVYNQQLKRPTKHRKDKDEINE